MEFRGERLAGIICCPACRGKLAETPGALRCASCSASYGAERGVPILMTPESMAIFNPTPGAPAERVAENFAAAALRKLTPCHVTIIDAAYLRAFDGLPKDALILNLGSGAGLFDKAVGREMINLDVFLNDRVHVVGDALRLPFEDGSFDGVFSNAVLEHVAKPWVAAREIERVLKPGGIVSVQLPFMNPIHDERDYFRFTGKGIRMLFEDFDEAASGVSAGGGSFWPNYMMEYLALFVPGRYAKKAFGFLWAMTFYRLKWLDRLVKSDPRYPVTATGFYFVGIKREK